FGDGEMGRGWSGQAALPVARCCGFTARSGSFLWYVERCPMFFLFFSTISSLYLHLSTLFITRHEQNNHLALRHTV
ncbi:hypothetical protein MRO71_19615, partial [Dickeya dianthicola]